jgi:hypothetical protein
MRVIEVGPSALGDGEHRPHEVAYQRALVHGSSLQAR